MCCSRNRQKPNQTTTEEKKQKKNPFKLPKKWIKIKYREDVKKLIDLPLASNGKKE